MSYDFCVIGHITRDRIEISGSPVRMQPGGTCYYSGLAAARLGLRTAAITRMRDSDQSLLLADILEAGVYVRAIDSPFTTEYVNAFSNGNFDDRTQKVLAVALPFHPDDIDVDADVYVFGPLTHSELSSACVDRAAATGKLVAIDVQGLIRHVRGSQVEHVPSNAAVRMLRRVHIVKAGVEEAMLLTGETTIDAAARALSAVGPREVLVTSGSNGSHVLANGKLTRIHAFAPPAVVDTTGCGDTYLAAYVARRLNGDTPENAGYFASRVAGAKTAFYGAFRGEVNAVHPTFEASTVDMSAEE